MVGIRQKPALRQVRAVKSDKVAAQPHRLYDGCMPG